MHFLGIWIIESALTQFAVETDYFTYRNYKNSLFNSGNSKRIYEDQHTLWDKTRARRMASFGMLRHVALVITDVSEELGAFFIRVTRIGEPGTMLAVTSNRHMLSVVSYS
jgi:hypothetical protein